MGCLYYSTTVWYPKLGSGDFRAEPETEERCELGSLGFPSAFSASEGPRLVGSLVHRLLPVVAVLVALDARDVVPEKMVLVHAGPRPCWS